MFDFNLEELFNPIINPFDWDKSSYRFNREEKDMHPYSIIKKEKELIIVHNILGIEKADIKLSLKKEEKGYYITIEGATKDKLTGKTYSISSKFAVDPLQLNLETIKSTSQNGLLYIIIPTKQEEVKNKTTRIEVL